MVAAPAPPGATTMPTINPPAADTAVRIKWRRLKVEAISAPCIATSSDLRRVRSAMYGAAQTFIRAATANIGDAGVDVGVGRFRKTLQKSSHGHDLSRLAVAALRNAFFDPGALHRMIVV